MIKLNINKTEHNTTTIVITNGLYMVYTGYGKYVLAVFDLVKLLSLYSPQFGNTPSSYI